MPGTSSKTAFFSVVVGAMTAGAAAQVQTGHYATDQQSVSGVDPSGLICNGDGTFHLTRCVGWGIAAVRMVL
jgi:hypothetical protein